MEGAPIVNKDNEAELWPLNEAEKKVQELTKEIEDGIKYGLLHNIPVSNGFTKAYVDTGVNAIEDKNIHDSTTFMRENLNFNPERAASFREKLKMLSSKLDEIEKLSPELRKF